MIRVLDRNFEVSIPKETILQRVSALAEQLNRDYEGRNPVVVCMLNGAFVFAADLVRMLSFQHEVLFCRYSSYEGMESSGHLKEVMGISDSIAGRDVIILEDIVDTGYTMESVLPKFREKNPASVKLACMLFKPAKLVADISVDYYAMEIPNEFIIGYGLDYNGMGRHLPDIYTVVE